MFDIYRQQQQTLDRKSNFTVTVKVKAGGFSNEYKTILITGL